MKNSILENISRELIDRGLIIEAGWQGLKATLSPDAPQIQLDEMRIAFFAGAKHVFSSIMSMLEPGSEPTDKDEQRMENIDKELTRFVENFMLNRCKPEGTG